MNFAKASIDVPLGVPDTCVAWNDFEGFHRFLRDPAAESFEEACLRVVARLGKGGREWFEVEIATAHGMLTRWHGVMSAQGTSEVKLDPLENGETRLRIEIPPTLFNGREASPQAIQRVSARLQDDLRTFCAMVREKLALLNSGVS